MTVTAAWRFTVHVAAVTLLLFCTLVRAGGQVGLLPSTSPIITTYAGIPLPISGTSAVTQAIDRPESVDSDGAGGFYFVSTGADAGLEHNRIYRVNAGGMLTVIAGNGRRGFSGDGGLATSAQLNYPNGVALDGIGNLFIADSGNHRIRKVDVNGIITSVAGSASGSFGGFSGDGGPATSAQLAGPRGVAVDVAGNVFIADVNNYRIRRLDTNGIITTVAGVGPGEPGGDGGLASAARLGGPDDVAVDGNGNLFIAGSGTNRIRKVDINGIITTVAGNGTRGYSGDGGLATSAQLNRPATVAVDGTGSLFIADFDNRRIRKVDTNGIITTVAGNGTRGYSGDGGLATSAQLNSPLSVAVDGTGILFIADTLNHRIRKVDASGVIATVAGSGAGSFGGFSGDGGLATSAQLYAPLGVTVDANGNLFIADSLNERIRKVNSSGMISTVAGNGTRGYSGDGGLATSAQLNNPTSVAVDGNGNLFIADSRNNRIRRVDASGMITTVVGSGMPGFSGDGGLATSAQLNNPISVAVDGTGILFIADYLNDRIRKLDTSGVISTVAGNGMQGFSGDGGPAVSAQVAQPRGIAVDDKGNLFISAAFPRVRKVDANGIIVTVAGNGTQGFSGDGGAATSAQLAYPGGVAVDGSGNIFFTDTGAAFGGDAAIIGSNLRIRRVDTEGTITTVAGTGTYASSGDGGLAKDAQLAEPLGVAVDRNRNLFIAETYANRIRKVSQVTAIDASAFVSETIPDNASMLPGQSYTKTWTLRNTGSTMWDARYSLQSLSGTAGCSPPPVTVSGTVAPTATYTFTINCTAPMPTATYREDWRLVGPSGRTINVGSSPTIWVQIKVASGVLLTFGPIGSPQAAGVPFPITLRAVDAQGAVVTTFVGDVPLSSTRGTVTPTKVTFVSGQASANVTIAQPVSQVAVTARMSGVSYQSLPFAVTGAMSLVEVIVRVRDPYGPVRTARVTANGATDGKSTDVQGFANLGPMTCGDIVLKADKGLREVTETVEAKCGVPGGPPPPPLVVTMLLRPLCNASGKTPIILLPGILGSTTGKALTFPTLPPVGQAPDPIWQSWRTDFGFSDLILGTGRYGLFDPLNKTVGWAQLIQSLESNGYEVGCTIFPAPYDWRLGIDDAVEAYLAPLIRTVKQQSGMDKVDIIAHSMGGLVARAYIQDRKGRFATGEDVDVEKLAIVGTPNAGTIKAFFLWVGGDVNEADTLDLTTTLSTVVSMVSRLYEKTIAFLYEQETKDSIYVVANVVNKKRVRDFIQGKDSKSKVPILSVRDLLPTFPFLIAHGTSTAESLPAEYDNKWLRDLNKVAVAPWATTIGNGLTLRNVTVKVFGGSFVPTIIPLLDVRTEKTVENYGSVAPWIIRNSSDGDGSVLTTSLRANIPTTPTFAHTDGAHATLIHAHLNQLVDFITGSSPLLTRIAPKIDAESLLAANIITGPAMLNLSVHGPAVALLEQVNAPSLGTGVTPGLVSVTTLPESELMVSGGETHIAVGHPYLSDGSGGPLRVRLTTTGAGDYAVSIALLAGDDLKTREFRFHTSHSDRVLLLTWNQATESFNVDVGGTPPDPVTTSPSGLATLVSWPVVSGATGYRVFRRRDAFPNFDLVASVDGATTSWLATDDLWSSAVGVPVTEFAVSSLTGTNESAFSFIVDNNDQDSDGLADAEEAALGTDPTRVDTDGDGLSDWSEVAIGTNPLTADSDGDGVSDGNEYRVGSDPQRIEVTTGPTPQISGISPTSVLAGQDFVLTVQGSGFFNSVSLVRVAGVAANTTYLSGSQLVATVPAALCSPGSCLITVDSPSPGGGLSNSYPLTVTLPPGPVISSLSATPSGLSQTVAPLFGGPFMLTINGQNFGAASTIKLGSTSIPTSFIDDTQLRASVTTPMLAVQGNVAVTVVTLVGQTEVVSNVVDLKIVERGDINGSRSVNIGDALVTALNVGGVTKPALPNSVGDVNLSGSVNIGDALVLALFAGRVTGNLPIPTIASLSSSPISAGMPLTITGTGFGANVSDNQVVFTTSTGGVSRIRPIVASRTSLTVTVPDNAASGAIQVYRTDTPLAGAEFPIEVTGTSTPLRLAAISPFFRVTAGTPVTLSGLGFDAIPANNTVLFKSSSGTVAGTVNSATPTSLTVTVPAGAECGPVTVAVGSQTSNARIVTIFGTSCGLRPTDIWGAGSPGDILVLEGTGFSVTNPSDNIVKFTVAGGGTVNATVVAAGGTQLQVRIPGAAVTGNVSVTVGGTTSTGLIYTRP